MLTTEGLTLQVKAIRRQARLSVTGNGRGLVSRAGTGLVVETARQLQLERSLAQATVGVRPLALHSPAGVLNDLSLMLADGGTRLRHLDVLRGQPALFGTVASVPTTTRTLAALADADIDATVYALDVARAQVRRRGWEHGALPGPVADVLDGEQKEGGPLCVDLDATLVIAHSDDKDGAGKTYKRSWGFHPMTAWLDRGDGTGEALATELRKGNAGANNGADQVAIVDRAIAQLPELPDELKVLIRADTAGAVHELLAHIRDQGCLFSVGMRLQGQVRATIHALDQHDPRWQQAITQQGMPRKKAAVAEITDLVELSAWPVGARLIVRREPLHPGAQQTFDDIDGYRFTAFLTDQSEHDIAILDARHRAHARVEDRIRCAKDTGLASMPCDTFDRNQLWCQLVMIAADLLVFTQQLALRGHHRVAEPRALRYQLLHVAGRIIRSGRQTVMHLQADWPYTAVLLAAFRRLRALPTPAG
jgi:hypothetical protein